MIYKLLFFIFTICFFVIIFAFVFGLISGAEDFFSKKALKRAVLATFLLLAIFAGVIFLARPFDSQRPYNPYEILLEYKPSYKRNINPTLKAKLDLCMQFGKNIDSYLGLDDKTLYLKYFLNSLFIDCTLEDLESFLKDYERICDIVYAYGDSEENIKQGLRDLCKEYDLSTMNYAHFGSDYEMGIKIDNTFRGVQRYLENKKDK